MPGNYVFNLDSTFDNYLYVIDPRSSEILVNNVDCNDDGGSGFNAKLTVNLETGVDYLIICAKYNPGASLNSADSNIIRLQISQTGLPYIPNNPEYLQLKLLSRSGFIVYDWLVRIYNPNPYAAHVTYNSKMCFESDAKNFTGLKDLVTVTIPSYSSIAVTIKGNGTAGWITTSIDYSYCGQGYRRVACANGLSGSLTMNAPVNTQITYK